MATDRFNDQLRQQLLFIKNSCDAWDRGERHEAIRVATSARVLFHQTPKSTSLLTHLGVPDLPVLSTTAPIAEVTPGLHREVMCLFAGGFAPRLGRVPGDFLELPAPEWWTAPIAVFNGVPFNRKWFVLTAADKDGGAHVDDGLPPEYETLVAGIWTAMSRGVVTDSVPDHHLLYLRQIGYEIVNSPQLTALAA